MKKIISLILCFLMIISVCSIPAFAENNIVASGKCGETAKDNVKWSVNYFGDLTISGSGNIIFNSEYNAPWKAYGIKTVNVEEGIIGIGAYNFAHLDDMYLIKLPKSLNHIDGSLYIGSRPEYKTIAVSYAGTESDWKKVETIRDFYETKQLKMFYEGYEPKAFCEITNGDDIAVKAGEDTILYYNYYSNGNPAEIEYASVLKNGELINGSDIPGQVSFKTTDLNKEKITVELYDKDDILLASDDILVHTSLSDNLLYRVKNIPETLKEIAVMIGELPHLIILAFSLGGLSWLTPIIHLFVS